MNFDHPLYCQFKLACTVGARSWMAPGFRFGERLHCRFDGDAMDSLVFENSWSTFSGLFAAGRQKCQGGAALGGKKYLGCCLLGRNVHPPACCGAMVEEGPGEGAGVDFPLGGSDLVRPNGGSAQRRENRRPPPSRHWTGAQPRVRVFFTRSLYLSGGAHSFVLSLPTQHSRDEALQMLQTLAVQAWERRAGKPHPPGPWRRQA